MLGTMWIDFSLCFASAEGDSRTRVLGRLTTVFQRLVGLGETRDQLKQLRRTFDTEEQRSLGPYHSLLAQVTRVTITVHWSVFRNYAVIKY